MSRKRLSKNFTVEEFDCHDGTKVPNSAIPALEELCEHILEPLRGKYGPCKVNSGYRTKRYNADIGGASQSQHIYEDTPGSVAADVKFTRGNPTSWARSARWRFRTKSRWRRRGRGGCGRYIRHAFVHVDSGPRRNWEG